MGSYVEDGFEGDYRPELIALRDESGWYAEHADGEVIELAYGLGVPWHVVRDQLEIMYPEYRVVA